MKFDHGFQAHLYKSLSYPFFCIPFRISLEWKLMETEWREQDRAAITAAAAKSRKMAFNMLKRKCAWIIIYRNWKLKTSQSKHKTCVIHTHLLELVFFRRSLHISCNVMNLTSFILQWLRFKLNYDLGFVVCFQRVCTQKHEKSACLITHYIVWINWNVRKRRRKFH